MHWSGRTPVGAGLQPRWRRSARWWTTPQAVMLASLPLCADRSSLSETAPSATSRCRDVRSFAVGDARIAIVGLDRQDDRFGCPAPASAATAPPYECGRPAPRRRRRVQWRCSAGAPHRSLEMVRLARPVWATTSSTRCARGRCGLLIFRQDSPRCKLTVGGLHARSAP
jgi:hypothetical protein